VKPLELKGRRFGRLLVIERVPSTTGMTYWSCVCDCGESKRVRAGHLSQGLIRSCGCLARELLKKPDDEITYNSAHYRVKRAKGRPSEHNCVDCGRAGEDWSLKADSRQRHWGLASRGYFAWFSGDPADYEVRCRKCHKRHDMELRKRGPSVPLASTPDR
jgi:hypothetical protein